ncbi:sulfite exporter TauE/SafE family protein, partial [Candidatus Uhrbacteria bacterium]|nr:sulfite exporter TauE/SafE family protein [Candidatus Uhrbacteria bacterium]
MSQKHVSIRGMHCRSCEILLEGAIREVQGVQNVRVNYHKGEAVITHGADIPSQKEIERVIKQSGYDVGKAGPLPWITQSPEDWRYILVGFAILVILFFVLRGTGLLGLTLNESAVTLPFALVLGLVAGISTCMALVGGLVLGVAARHAELHPEATPWQKLRPHLFFNAGRVGGYALFGGLLGSLGSVLNISGGMLSVLTLIVGAVMLALGIKLTNISPRISAKSITLPPSLARLLGMSEHAKEYSPRASVTSGALTFFLPCGFTQAMQLYAVSTGDFWTGALVLGAFALGTV